MKTRSKILIAGAIAATIGGLALAGTSYAHRGGQGQGRHMMGGRHMSGGMHGMGMMRGGHMRGMAVHQFFKTADANEDGKVTQAEIDKALADRLARHDSNKDGKLSLEEFEGVWLEMSRPMMVRRFQRLDPDGDAAITGEELSDRFGNLVKRLDRNGDGALSREDRHHRMRGGMRGEPKKPEGGE